MKEIPESCFAVWTIRNLAEGEVVCYYLFKRYRNKSYFQMQDDTVWSTYARTENNSGGSFSLKR